MTTFLRMQDDWLLMNIDGKTILKIDSTGTPDVSFGTNGKVTLNLPPVNGFTYGIRALVQQADKKILAITPKNMVRLNTDGSLDNTFGSSGIVTMSSSFGNEKMVVRIQQDGKILIGAGTSSTLIYRYLPNGTPDNSFAGDGSTVVRVLIPTTYETPFSTQLIDFELQPDGKIVVMCMKNRAYGIPNPTPHSNYRDIILFRVNTNGSMDYSFGGVPHPTAYAGTTHLSLPFTEEVPGDLLLMPDNRLLIAGYLNNGTGWDIGLVLVKNNGQYDSACTIQGFNLAGFDNVIQNRVYEGDFSLTLLPGENGTYLLGGSQMGQGIDYFVTNFLSPSSPMANYTSFNATKDTGCFRVNISWQTDYECSVDSFNIEYSADLISFIKIGSVLAGGNQLNMYSFIHSQAKFGNNYYRLRLFSNGTGYSVTPVKTVAIPNTPVANIIWQNIIATDRGNTFDVELQWQTLFEQGSSEFEIQVSTDSVNFATIKTVAAAGNSSVLRQYSTTITNLIAGKYYFRIQILGTGCRYNLSVIQSIILSKQCEGNLIITPNPVRDILKVNVPQCEQGTLRVTNTIGQIILIIKNINQPQIEIDCSSLAPAMYFIQFLGTKTHTTKFIKL